MGFLAHAEGRDTDAIARLTRGLPGNFIGFPAGANVALAEGVYGDAAKRASAVAMIDSYLATRPKTVSAAAPWALLLLGEPARALAVARDPQTANDTLFLSSLWSAQGAAARRLPEFPEFTRKMGLTAVWEKYGPPDDCQRKGAGDYVCR